MAMGVTWASVLEAEHAAISARRKRNDRPPVGPVGKSAPGPTGSAGAFDTTGVALSGGGIRSAAFCLGAMQAMAEKGRIDHIDYLSTVSGGGYTGSAITAAMTEGKEGFPFQGPRHDFRDPPALGHLRDYSNYLIPRGKISLLFDIAIMLRGLFSNVLLVLPIILLLAALTIWLNPTVDSLNEPFTILPLIGGRFAFTIWLLAIGSAIYVVWAIYRSIARDGTSEFTGWFVRAAAWFLVLLAAVAFLELQPVVVGWMHAARQSVENGAAGERFSFTELAKAIVTYLTPIVAVISLFAKRIGDFLQSSDQSAGVTMMLKRFMGRALIGVVALALPIILWMVYLLFVYWGIPGAGKDIAPSWLWAIWYRLDLPVDPDFPAFAKVYGLIGFAIIALSWFFLSPNANSLHRLYRDRLSDAFLASKDKANSSKLVSRDVKLSAIDTENGPYQLINVALNIQGSPQANARGRNADYFVFSKLYSGSSLSGYLPTTAFETQDKALTLGTAMAISGAAVSSNMGGSSIGHMAPTLALLNLRLGYWLKNPAGGGWLGNIFYLVKEMLSNLRPDDKYLYLTDGGHIDNTGLYELLRRRCALIIVIDAEADPEMTFGSFVKVQRHARIDLGVRINMRWDKIVKASLDARKEGAKGQRGPHCAAGEIEYSNGGKGRLIYVKSSLTGDENVYVRDYARRHPEFPHEMTSDQFFSEEQFEVYRALGFHCVNGLFKSDAVEVSASGVEYRGTNLRFDRANLAGFGRSGR